MSKKHTNLTSQVDHPVHYNQHPAGVECIDIIEHFNFNVGNAIKYLWRASLKGEPLEDLEKAAWYTQREIGRINETFRKYSLCQKSTFDTHKPQDPR